MNDKQSLDPRLRAKLKSLETLPERDPQVVEDGRAKFLSQAQSLAAPVSVAGDRRHNTWMKSKFTKKESRSMLTTLASLLIALTLAFGGAGATVYASQDSLPNDFLYPVKIISEDLQLALINDDYDEFTMLHSFTQRRWGEVNALLNQGEVVPPETLTRLEYQIASMFSLAAGLEDAEMEGALKQIQTMLQQGEKALTRAGQQDQILDQSGVMEGATEMLHHQHRVVENALEDQNAFRERFDSAGNHPGEYPEKTPGAGNENGAQQGNGQQDDGICYDLDAEDVLTLCVCEGDPDRIPDPDDELCILVPIMDSPGPGPGTGGSGSNGSGNKP
ncbi:MAG: DUF5667 domain-containing protein [Chloroflexota bacterium]